MAESNGPHPILKIKQPSDAILCEGCKQHRDLEKKHENILSKKYVTYGIIGTILVITGLIAFYISSKMIEASALLPPSHMDINTVIRMAFIGGFILGASASITAILWYSVSNGEQKSDSIISKE
jgi:hypothetical protein